ncbi:hypothetical protein EDC14_10583 [Hydrogenispora ethanolica]|uniref:Uncharacterized protein n=1 Tax=Hydrogenispora ethanolica TaxID=1082276 RepID=A0A4R1QWV4_HYDET|nr:hypothetical protein [Hydrogenispora ethanolica]TCL54950.1 hypothetical protein EDC14_10583 [Hydrogenispora ethanolica]
MDFMKMWKQSYYIAVVVAVATLFLSFAYTVLDITGWFSQMLQNMERDWVAFHKGMKPLWLRLEQNGVEKCGRMLNKLKGILLPE